MFSNRTVVPALLMGVLMLILGKASGVAQDKSQGANIKLQSTNVLVDVIVTDHKGRHVPGLAAKDFAIYEDGVPQKIAGFTMAENVSSDDVEAAPSTATAASGGPVKKSPSKDPRLLTVVLDLADNRP